MDRGRNDGNFNGRKMIECFPALGDGVGGLGGGIYQGIREVISNLSEFRVIYL